MDISSLQKFCVYEPRVELGNKRSWAIEKGGSVVTPFVIPATSYSNSNVVWQVVPPSKQSILDRVVVAHVPVTLTFAGTTSDGSNLLQPGKCGLRSRPIQRMFSTLSMAVNGQTISLEPQQIVQALERVKAPLEADREFYSIFPCMTDKYATYGDASLANNNALAIYADNPAENSRGSYRMNVTSNTTTAATVQIDLYEYIVLPPLLFGADGDGIIREAGGLTHLDTFVVNAAMTQNLARIWCNANPTFGSSPSTATITSLTVNISARPELHLWWITPRLTEQIPMKINYPYFNVQRYTTGTVATLAPNASATIQSTVMQFQSVPHKIYIFARRSDSDIFSTLLKTIGSSDTFVNINSIAINFNNVSGLLSQASQLQLYEMSLQNGLSESWDEFGGYTQLLSSSGSTTTIGTVGSLLVIDPAKDFGLDSSLANGSLGQFNFQIAQMNITNQNQYETFPIDLYVIAVYEGVMEISYNQAPITVGVASKEDVLSAVPSHVGYHALRYVYGGGGDFFSDFAKGFEKGFGDVLNFVKDNKLISKGLGIIPHPGTQIASQVADLLGFGEGEGVGAAGRSHHRKHRKKGGVLLGGEGLSVRDMKKRLM